MTVAVAGGEVRGRIAGRARAARVVVAAMGGGRDGGSTGRARGGVAAGREARERGGRERGERGCHLGLGDVGRARVVARRSL